MSVSRIDREPATTITNPRTGEILTESSPTEDLAGCLADLKTYRESIKVAEQLIQGELRARMDKNAKWTEHLPGGLKMSVPSPAPEEVWDGVELHSRLLNLVDEGLLSIAAVQAAVSQEVKYTVRKAGINALRKAGGPAAEIVNELAEEMPKARYVRVERKL